jgi:hypothetical protein
MVVAMRISFVLVVVGMPMRVVPVPVMSVIVAAMVVIAVIVELTRASASRAHQCTSISMMRSWSPVLKSRS